MKLLKLRHLVPLALCALMLTGTVFAASTIYKTITVTYSGVSLVVDGVPVVPKTANGSVVEPFIYNGTTYLPVRAVGEALGKQVTWDGTTQTVYIGEAPGQVQYLMDVCPPYETHLFDDPSTFKMSGKTYTHGFTMNNMDSSKALFNLDGKYQTLSCDIGHVDGSPAVDCSIEIYLDGNLSQVIDIGYEDMVQHFDIPLQNALQLKIVMTGGRASVYGNARYGIASATLS